jgi:hypothetical protein
MRITRCLVLMVASTSAMTLPVSAAVYTQWSVGMEREVAEGVYMKLMSVSEGWRIWGIETKSEVDCRAIKSAVGRVHPIPAGAGAVFFRGTPFLMVYKGYQTPHTYSWNTTHWGDVDVQYRLPGEKFWSPMNKYEDDLSQFNGKKLEISLTSWEYPDINVGYAKETGVIDLAGMNAAVAAVDQCNVDGKK